MQTALFLALLDEHNIRGNPILSALLYLYCPAAARWWTAGADPVPVFDPVWQALKDWCTTGNTLKEMLDQYGLGEFGSDAQTFVSRVDAYRRQHPEALAPELSATFNGFRLSKEKKVGHREAIDNLGGRWENLLRYVHAWAVLIHDWKNAMRFQRMPDIESIQLALGVDQIRSTAHFPSWLWTRRHSAQRRASIGMLIEGDPRKPQRQIEAALFAASVPLRREIQADGSKGKLCAASWQTLPDLWRISRTTGTGNSYRSQLPKDVSLSALVRSLAALAKDGPHPPINALQHLQQCETCGFHRQCWIGDRKASEIKGIEYVSSLAVSHLILNTRP